jgi:hypothetical protein
MTGACFSVLFGSPIAIFCRKIGVEIMGKTDYQELKLKQTELFVARQIFNEFNQIHKPDLYIKQLPLRNIGDDDFTFRDFHYQHMGLQRLVAQNLIQILNADEILKIGIHVHIVDTTVFTTFYTNLFESIPATGVNARIVYSKKTGRGKMNGRPFKLNRDSRNRHVFEYLAKRPNTYITKPKLWQIAGEKGKFTEDTDSINEFNTIITTLREALKNISPEHLRLKKTIILDADVTLTD